VPTDRSHYVDPSEYRSHEVLCTHTLRAVPKLTHCVQCPNVAVVAYLTILLKLDNVDNDTVERAAGLISARTTTDILFHLALDV
jgi:hypothetical protein